ncbi:hypothetical protein CHS0354_007150 [Potamilus streckersoni]|uniref:Uncharacterized protein n=1 Tax=Potamilus streckersoni TaxID=2493646 RepID=A0AAE0VUM4_9BIVA|nr:hypothetical protein CHS0354_007150 [Potamilus streckersoni]
MPQRTESRLLLMDAKGQVIRSHFNEHYVHEELLLKSSQSGISTLLVKCCKHPMNKELTNLVPSLSFAQKRSSFTRGVGK